MDILAGYAIVNGRRSVYLPVIKRADASTLDVVGEVRRALPQMRALVPEDITVDFAFDQSEYVTSAIRSLTIEGLLGAFLTGVAVLVFLRDVRGALIVIMTIPLALLAAVVGLWIAGQTINLMTLGGLTLAIGILVDESTVAIENIHTHMRRERNTALAVLNAGAEVAIPQFLAMLCVAAVFTPALFMVGPGRALFVPLALAVALAMTASYFLARTFVPVMATWLLRGKVRTSARAIWGRAESSDCTWWRGDGPLFGDYRGSRFGVRQHHRQRNFSTCRDRSAPDANQGAPGYPSRTH
jgi:multidrug efflux pump subunit AcrB